MWSTNAGSGCNRKCLFIAIALTIVNSSYCFANPLFVLGTDAADIDFDEQRHLFYAAHSYEPRIDVFSATSFRKTDEIPLSNVAARLKLSANGDKLLIAHKTSSSVEIIYLANRSSEVVIYSPGFNQSYPDIGELNSGNIIVSCLQGSYPNFFHINLTTGIATEILLDLIQYPTIPVIRNNPIEEGFFVFKPHGVSDELFKVAITGDEATVVGQSPQGKGMSLYRVKSDGSLILSANGLISNTTDFWPRASIGANYPIFNRMETKIYALTNASEVRIFDAETFELLGTLNGPNLPPLSVLGGQTVAGNFTRIYPTTSGEKLYIARVAGANSAIAILYPQDQLPPPQNFAARTITYESLENDPTRNVLYGSTESKVHVITPSNLAIQNTYDFPATLTKGLDLRASGNELLVALTAGGSIAEIDLLSGISSRQFVAPIVNSSKINDVQEISENRIAFVNSLETNIPYNAGLIREDMGDVLSIANGAQLSAGFLEYNPNNNELFASQDGGFTKTDLSVEPGTFVGLASGSDTDQSRTAPGLRPDGQVIATGGGLVGDTVTFNEITLIAGGAHKFSESGAYLYSATNDGEFKVYDGQTFVELRSFPLPCKITNISSMVLAANESIAVVSGYHREVQPFTVYPVTCKVPINTTNKADLRLEPLSAPNILRDGITKFEFRIFNDGPNDATNVYFDIEASSTVEIHNAQTNGELCTGIHGAWCSIPSVPSGSFTDVTIDISQRYNPQFAIFARVSSEVEDLDASNNYYNSVLEPTYEIARYFPTDVGNAWDYEDLDGHTYRIDITSNTILINGINTIAYERSDDLNNYFTNDENGLRWHAQLVEQYDFGDGVQRRADVVFYPPVVLSPAQAIADVPIDNSGIARFNIQGIGVFNLNYFIRSKIANTFSRTVLGQVLQSLYLTIDINLGGNINGTAVSSREFNNLRLALDLGPFEVREYQFGAFELGTTFHLTAANLDRDDDGQLDAWDNCPDNANSEQMDNDSDKIGDACDENDDNDIATDQNDDFPLDAMRTKDFDNDGIDDTLDSDKDNDGILDYWEVENNLNPFDSNDADLDSDGDLIVNRDEFLNNTNPLLADAPNQVVPIDLMPGRFLLVLGACLVVFCMVSLRNKNVNRFTRPPSRS